VTYQGVEDMGDGRWEAKVQVGDGYALLGVYPTEEKAARAADVATVEIHPTGPSGALNFPKEYQQVLALNEGFDADRFVGRKFGRLTAIDTGVVGPGIGGDPVPDCIPYWYCHCECGARVSRPASLVHEGWVKSCGCRIVEYVRRNPSPTGGAVTVRPGIVGVRLAAVGGKEGEYYPLTESQRNVVGIVEARSRISQGEILQEIGGAQRGLSRTVNTLLRDGVLLEVGGDLTLPEGVVVIAKSQDAPSEEDGPNLFSDVEDEDEEGGDPEDPFEEDEAVLIITPPEVEEDEEEEPVAPTSNPTPKAPTKKKGAAKKKAKTVPKKAAKKTQAAKPAKPELSDSQEKILKALVSQTKAMPQADAAELAGLSLRSAAPTFRALLKREWLTQTKKGDIKLSGKGRTVAKKL